MIDPISLVGIAGAPLVMALVQLVRVSEPDLPSRYLPALTLLLAVLLNLFLATLVGSPIALALLVGLVTGLTASGLYSHATAGMMLGRQDAGTRGTTDPLAASPRPEVAASGAAQEVGGV